MGKRMTRTIRVALSVTGSAILLFSCADKDAGRASASEETMMTEYSEDLSVVMSQNGRRSYHFVTPLLEGYSLAREPYREFRKGVKITTYQNDSLTTVDAVLTANYAIYYENRELWEAKGNVVVEKSDGKPSTPSSCSGMRGPRKSIRTSIRRSCRTTAAMSSSAKVSNRTRSSRTGVFAA